MSGMTHFLFVAEVILLMVWRCLVFVAPVIVLAAFWWLINRTEFIIDYLFPHLEWERSLGWLNIRATRRAETALRWLGYGIHTLLAVALYGIVWGAEELPKLDQWPDPAVIEDLAIRVPVLLVCLGLWLLYFGCWLIPRLRDQREKKELERFRVEAREAEEKRQKNPASRVKSPLVKPRTNITLVPDRSRRRR